MKKRIIRVIVLVLILGGAGYGWYRYQSRDNGMIAGNLRIYGTIEVREAGLAFNEQERLIEVLVEEGQRVEPGQVLARLQPARLQAALEEAEAQLGAQTERVRRLQAGTRSQEIDQGEAELEAARVRVENTRQMLERLKRTSGSGATSEQDLDDARARLAVEEAQVLVREKALNLLREGPRVEDIAAAEHQLQALQAKRRLLQIRIGDLTLTAPAAGIIRTRILEPGEMAGPSRPAVTLALTDPKWVRAYLPEPHLGSVAPGMTAAVYSDSYPEEPLNGWVGSISPTAEFTPRTVQTEDLRTQLVYETRVFVLDPENRLRLGMPVSVAIETERRPGESPVPGGGENPHQ